MRRFGVEIEFARTGSLTTAQVVTALTNAGISVQNASGSYTGHSETQWQLKYDGSISGVNGSELVSPPLDFDNPDHRDQVDRAVEAVRNVGGQPHSSCGVHVHVEAADLNARQIAGVARCFTKFEDQIYRIATSGWRSLRPGAYQYAKPLPDEQVKKLAAVRNDQQLAKAWYGREVYPGDRLGHGHGSRYHGLNIHSWFYRKTIEFRVFNSTLNPKRIRAYTALCVALVEDARSGKFRSVAKRAYRLGDMYNGTFEEDNALHRLLQVFRYEAGMSKEDMKLVRYCWKDSRPQPADPNRRPASVRL